MGSQRVVSPFLYLAFRTMAGLLVRVDLSEITCLHTFSLTHTRIATSCCTSIAFAQDLQVAKDP